MPLLHLDAEHDLVQTIKLAEQIMGAVPNGRPPRLPLSAERRAAVTAMVSKAAAARPRHSSVCSPARSNVMKSVFFLHRRHTAGNPVRLVAGGAPFLNGASMSERRQDFLTRFDWIRLGLMFEPRGHDMMSVGLCSRPSIRQRCCHPVIETTAACRCAATGRLAWSRLHSSMASFARSVGRLSIEVPAG